MILPVAHTKIHPDQKLGESVQQLLLAKIAVYLMTFLIVTVAWAAHVRLFQVIELIDDVLALLNLACMMIITFLPYTSYVLLGLVIVFPHLTRFITWCKTKIVGQRDEEEHSSLETFTFYLSEPLSKERVEAFSDGVYAIVATLLILDICEDNVPDPREVKEKFHGSLLEALSEYGPNYLAYFGSFVTIGLLWFVHHSLFLYVTKATRLMGLLNILSLAFIGGLPLAYQLTSEFAEKSHNEIEAIQVSCVITFFASIFQFAIWTTALLHERETLHPFARYGGKEHAFMFAKLALYPCVSLGAFFLTCLLSEFSTAIFHLMQIVIPFAFLALRIFVRISLTIIKSVMSLSRRKVVLLEEEEACLSPSETLS
ncbi:endosomal/lysosomal potassium channel TMEM175 isoform X1 [Apteryx rowi]|uniref:endosomal/lysosomal potassium channel TMEM175 isoform X1 n=1 Tax=Apteryx rowi TaxID=308060 RepID=UPI000E1DCC3B|nr:endosomal/lysosomal potassium channel TMEM175 isoform X1 [Apteryx rowi]